MHTHANARTHAHTRACLHMQTECFPASTTALLLAGPLQPSPPPFGESEMTFAWIKSKRIKAGETFAMSAEGGGGGCIRLWTWLECRCLRPPEGHTACVCVCVCSRHVMCWRSGCRKPPKKETMPLRDTWKQMLVFNANLNMRNHFQLSSDERRPGAVSRSSISPEVASSVNILIWFMLCFI